MAIKTIMGNNTSSISQNAVDINQALEVSIYPRGIPGYSYVPSVNEDGYLVWNNDGGLINPENYNLSGYVFVPEIDTATGVLKWKSIKVDNKTDGDGNQGENAIINIEAAINQNPIDMRGYIALPSIDSNGNITWTTQPVSSMGTVASANIKGPQGDKGDIGDPFNVAGVYQTEDQLIADLSNLNDGDFAWVASDGSIEAQDLAELKAYIDTKFNELLNTGV